AAAGTGHAAGSALERVPRRRAVRCGGPAGAADRARRRAPLLRAHGHGLLRAPARRELRARTARRTEPLTRASSGPRLSRAASAPPSASARSPRTRRIPAPAPYHGTVVTSPPEANTAASIAAAVSRTCPA